MMEKVAAAIYESMMVGLSEDEKRAIGFADWTCHDMARAAIEAMREPTLNMAGVGCDRLRDLMGDDDIPGRDASRVYLAMIDAALSETPIP